TLREVALRETTPKGHFFGTYEQIADQIISWIENDAADGFIINPPVLGSIYTDFIKHVIPILEEKGYYERNNGATTLRQNLGLPYKPNRYANRQKGITR